MHQPYQPWNEHESESDGDKASDEDFEPETVAFNTKMSPQVWLISSLESNPTILSKLTLNRLS